MSLMMYFLQHSLNCCVSVNQTCCMTASAADSPTLAPAAQSQAAVKVRSTFCLEFSEPKKH